MAIGAVTEEIAENLEEAAVATRMIDAKAVGYFLGGVGVGVVIGFYFGHRWNREKIKAEAFKESEAELQKIREVYQQRTVAAQPKPPVEELVEERGYSGEVIEERPLPAPVPIHEGFTQVGPKRTADGEKSKYDGWSYPFELSQRMAGHPHIIHQDEFSGNETGFSQTTYTYYAADDVLTDTDDTVINNRQNIIGIEDNLLKFGHGTDDENVLYIRNADLQLEIEICRTPKSYEEEVLGVENRAGLEDDDPT